MEAIIFPAFAASSVFLLLFIKIYFKLRELFPASVSCWFCNSKAKVPYHFSNSWVCPSCDQYNGFAEDGGYNRIIEAQFDEHLNIPTSSTPVTRFKRLGPTLCHSCNINQQLKVNQLASFTPYNASNYDYEVEVFSKQLEKVYSICGKCENNLAEMFEKEKKTFSDIIKKPSLPVPTDNVKKFRRRSAVLYYATIISCLPQVLDILLTSVPKDFWIAGFENLNKYAVLSDSMKLLSAYKDEFDILYRFYVQHHYDAHFYLIGFCIFIYLVEFIVKRSILNLLNVSAWCILFSLKYFSKDFNDYIILLQGFTAAVFLFLNRKNKFRKIVTRHPPETIINSNVKTDNNIMNKVTPPKVTGPPSAFAAVTKPREIPKPAPPQKLPEFTTVVTRSRSRQNLLKPIDDFGISNLHLGSRRRTTVKNHLLVKPKPRFNPSTDLWNRNSVLLPPRLNIDDRILTSSPSPQMFDRSPPQTRCSSQTSGVGSLNSTPQPQERYMERDFDGYSDAPLNCRIPNQDMQPNFYMPCDPMYQQMSVTPYSYYQFAAMFHRMRTPPPSPPSFNTTDKTETHSPVQCSHNSFSNVLISLILMCNFSFISLMFYKEFIAQKV